MGHNHSKQSTSKANEKTNDVNEGNEELNKKTLIQKNVSDTNAKDEDHKKIRSCEMEESVISFKSKLKVKQCEPDDITKPMQETNLNDNDVSLQASRNTTAERSRSPSKSNVDQSGDFLNLALAKSSVTPNLVLGDETVKEEKHSTIETTKMVCTFEKERKEDLLNCSVLQSETNSENSEIMSKGIEYDEKCVDMRRKRTKNKVKKSRKQIITFYEEHVLTYFNIFWWLIAALQNSDILQAITAKGAFRDHAECALNMSQNTENVLRHLYPEGEIFIELPWSKSVAWKKLKDTLFNYTHFQRLREDALSFAVGDPMNFEIELSRWRRSGQIRSILNNENLRRIHLKSEAFRLATFDLVDHEFEPGKTIRLAFKGFFCDLDGQIRCYQCSREYNGTHLEGQAAHCQNSTEHRRNSIAESYGRRSTGYLLGHSQADELPIIDLHNQSLATSRHQRQTFRQLFSPEAELPLSRTVTSVPNDDNLGCHIPSPRNNTVPSRSFLSTANANYQVHSPADISRPTQPEECHQGICNCCGHVAVMDDPMNEMLRQFSSRQTNDRTSHSLRYNQQIDSHNLSSSALNDDPTSRLVHQNAIHQLGADETSPSTLTPRSPTEISKRKSGQQSQTFSDKEEFQTVSETVRSVAVPDGNNDDDEDLSSSLPKQPLESEGRHGLAENSDNYNRGMTEGDEHFNSRNEMYHRNIRHLARLRSPGSLGINGHNDHVHRTFGTVVPGESLVGDNDDQRLYYERTSERTSELPRATDAARFSIFTETSGEIGDTHVNTETTQGSSTLRVGTTSTEENIQQEHENSRQDSMDRLADGFASLSIGEAVEHEESTRRPEKNKTDTATQKK